MISAILKMFFFFYGLLWGLFSAKIEKGGRYRRVEEEEMTLFQALDRSLALGYHSVKWEGV